MESLYPLRFEPIYRCHLWGGRRLEAVLHKPLGPGNDFAESWEIVDHGAEQSVVLNGPLAGTTLHELTTQQGPALLGRHHPQPSFPLLLKFLDAQKTLSVQVHPNDQQGARLQPPDYGKTEAWYVIAVEPGSLIYAGLKRGFDLPALKRELSRGTAELCLHHFEPRPGDCVLVPAGIVHAIGAGIVLAEIQQSSDTTFRLYDWNRLGPDGQPRALHIDAALAVTDFERGPVNPTTPQSTQRPHVSQLVECEKFVWDRWQFDAPQAAGGDHRCHILAVIEGEVSLPGETEALRTGQTVLLPASLPPTILTPRGQTTLLDAYLP
ncbi:MAG: class I mannose-6-phosphate isomerase [Planctomycetes bacterium]|nr:class I mannose-6-phosphate isomerase [Planctomycetota bacterium]